MSDPLKPSATLLVKLGSAMVHADEFMSPGGHEYDLHTFRQLLADDEISAWLEAMDKMAFLPKKRKKP